MLLPIKPNQTLSEKTKTFRLRSRVAGLLLHRKILSLYETVTPNLIEKPRGSYCIYATILDTLATRTLDPLLRGPTNVLILQECESHIRFPRATSFAWPLMVCIANESLSLAHPITFIWMAALSLNAMLTRLRSGNYLLIKRVSNLVPAPYTVKL